MLGRARAWARPRCLSGLPWHLGTTENTMGTTGAKHINVHRTHIIGRMLPNTSHGCHQFSEYEYSLHQWYFYAARAMNTRNCLTRGKHEILLSAHAHSSPPLLFWPPSLPALLSPYLPQPLPMPSLPPFWPSALKGCRRPTPK